MVGKAERCNLVEKAGITKFLYLFAINHQSLHQLILFQFSNPPWLCVLSEITVRRDCEGKGLLSLLVGHD